MTPSPTETVTLAGGFTVSCTAQRLLVELEDRGFAIVAGSTGLIVRPHARLTAADDTAIRRHRDELLALVRYCDGELEGRGASDS